MKKILIITIIQVALILTFSSVSMADGNILLKECQSLIYYMDTGETTEQFEVGRCLGMVEGVRYSMMFHSDVLTKRWKACWPKDGINNGQSARIVVKYLKENPQLLHRESFYLVMEAYINAYPCK